MGRPQGQDGHRGAAEKLEAGDKREHGIGGRTERPRTPNTDFVDTDPYVKGPLIYDKIIINGPLEIPEEKEKSLNPYLTPYRTNSTCIQDLLSMR